MGLNPTSGIFGRFSRYRHRVSVVFLVVWYLVGTFGVSSPWRQQFIALSFLNLLVTAVILLANAEGATRRTFVAFALCAIAGFILEVVGVKTGKVFGVYAYSDNMGPRLFEVPWVIGINWAVLVHSMLAIFANTAKSRLMLAGIGATVMTAFDWLMEPAAIALGFWSWQGEAVPLQNYVAWWLSSAVLLYLVDWGAGRPKNRLAPWVVGVMLVFFAIVRRSSE